MSIRVIGVNPYALGWVGVVLRDGAFSQAVLAVSLFDLMANSSGVAVIGVDVPLGMLPDRWRQADTLAADYVGPRRGSLYRVAPRPVWQEANHAAAAKLCKDLTGHSLSRQSWAQRPKLLEANALWTRHPGLLVEARPEVSFRAMAGEPLVFAKTTWSGQAIRRQLLAGHGIVIPEQVGTAGQVPPDDFLDAAAVAWSAHRTATGTARSLPSPPEEDNDSKIAIWY